MQTISINFIVPQGWHELSDKQLRYVYELIDDNFATDDKSCQREQSQARLEYAECSRFCWEEIKTLCLLRWNVTYKFLFISAIFYRCRRFPIR